MPPLPLISGIVATNATIAATRDNGTSILTWDGIACEMGDYLQ